MMRADTDAHRSDSGTIYVIINYGAVDYECLTDGDEIDDPNADKLMTLLLTS